MNAFKRNAGKVLLGVSIAAGAAYATAGSIESASASSLIQTPTLYWNGTAWQTIPANFTVSCTGGGTRCTATGTPANPQNITPGTATLIPNP